MTGFSTTLLEGVFILALECIRPTKELRRFSIPMMLVNIRRLHFTTRTPAHAVMPAAYFSRYRIRHPHLTANDG